ncbi:TetR family transcriptional regulator [Mycobacterium sp. 852013-50091_SCH5140682]|uniref:TetR/AcrR family transcriptional regulator n=1 Tax=Mycobacterium sp. 852013-50091_SCH5140682 TaxID=1834109 RepID=UPI0007EA110C|nr:TetR/AcrR family transcriptional regulator [Mycobacterium sp. 852013-50091_SCH5140682]OBC17430.1 TetR family transcriptional regulator [Mycobacterium sp. 852013-50091_SCH5140682]
MDARKRANPPLPRTPDAAASPADRLLDSATKLFAAQGIRAVGIDHLLRDAAVAKASLYSTYGSKEALVIAYLTHLDLRDRNRYQEAVADVADPVARVLVFFDLAIAGARSRDFRGCLYANAATEFPRTELEPVSAHRRWLLDTVADLLAQAGVDHPMEAARDVQLIYDGAQVGSKVARSVAPIEQARRLAERLITGSGR